MSTEPRSLAVVALVMAATAAAAAQPDPAPGSRAWVESLKPEWSRPVGGKTRFVGVEEYGRCSVFVDNGVIQVVTPSGEVAWSWAFSKISRYINPGKVAVAHDCDVIAFVGDASYKYAWVVDKTGRSASLKFTATPADVEFDRAGKYVAVGTFAGSLFLYSVNGEFQWQRDTKTAIVSDLSFTDDNQRIVFKGWGGVGVVTVAGQVEWGLLATRLRASNDLETFVFSDEPNHGPGEPSFTVTDGRRQTLWSHIGSLDAYLSSTGDRVLASLPGVTLSTRDGTPVTSYPDYASPLALSEDGKRAWLRADDHIACVDDSGRVLATIDGEVSDRGVKVSRNFAQILVVTEKDLTPVAVERYAISSACRQ
jgi:hypothetical protein